MAAMIRKSVSAPSAACKQSTRSVQRAQICVARAQPSEKNANIAPFLASAAAAMLVSISAVQPAMASVPSAKTEVGTEGAPLLSWTDRVGSLWNTAKKGGSNVKDAVQDVGTGVKGKENSAAKILADSKATTAEIQKSQNTGSRTGADFSRTQEKGSSGTAGSALQATQDRIAAGKQDNKTASSNPLPSNVGKSPLAPAGNPGPSNYLGAKVEKFNAKSIAPGNKAETDAPPAQADALADIANSPKFSRN